MKNNQFSPTISIIVPCYNESETLPIFYTTIKKIFHTKSLLKPYQYELVFIDDGSQDDTLTFIKQIAQKDSQVKYLSFSRNFGKESALYAGLQYCQGNFVAVMDADMQDPPEMLVEMLDNILHYNYDVVGCRRIDRTGEPPIRSFCAKLFYKFINHISDVEILDGVRDFRLMTRQVVNAILQVNEYNRFSKGIFSWIGFKTKYLPYQNIERIAGKTSWNFWSLLKYSIDGIIAFSDAPLILASYLGLGSCGIAFIDIILSIIRHIFWNNPITPWNGVMCLILFIGGLNLLFLGIIGKYLGKVLKEVQHRPNYLIRQTNYSINK